MLSLADPFFDRQIAQVGIRTNEVMTRVLTGDAEIAVAVYSLKLGMQRKGV